MDKRIRDFFRSDAGVLFLPAMLFFLLHLATNGQYGFHRDELQTLDDARPSRLGLRRVPAGHAPDRAT
jgi:hypothetical protein